MNISISKIKSFKSCRRLYELKYIEGLRSTQYAEALEIGKSYHALIDAYNKGEETDGGYTKEAAMFQAYKKYIAPKFTVKASEEWLEYDLGDGDMLVGKADGISEDGNIVEHKTTSSNITEQYEYDLQWDEQILAYMLMTGSRKVYYTVCKKPTIRQKQNETDEEFYQRMVEWYDTETDDKIRLIEIYRTDEEVETFKNELFAMRDEIKNAKHFYKNTCHCNMYGRRCEYSSVCLNYDPETDYIEFVKIEKENS